MSSCNDDSYNTEYLNHPLSCVTCWSWGKETQSIQSNEKKDESMTESLVSCRDTLSIPESLSLSNRCSTSEEFDFDIHVQYKLQKKTDTKRSDNTVEKFLSLSSKENMTSREEVSEEVREEVEADCISLAEPRDGIVSECNSHSTINTNQALSTVTLGFCDSIPTPCQHSCVNDKALDHNHDSGKTFCDSSTNEIRTSLVSCDSSTPQESCTPSVVTDDIHFQHKGSVGADTISNLRSLVLRRRVDDVYTKRMAKGEILGDNILKPPIQSERLQNLLVVTSTDQTIRYPLTRNTSSPRPSVRSTVLPPKRVYNLTSRSHRLNEKYKQTQDDLVSLSHPSSNLPRSSHKGCTRRGEGKKHTENH